MENPSFQASEVIRHAIIKSPLNNDKEQFGFWSEALTPLHIGK